MNSNDVVVLSGRSLVALSGWFESRFLAAVVCRLAMLSRAEIEAEIQGMIREKALVWTAEGIRVNTPHETGEALLSHRSESLERRLAHAVQVCVCAWLNYIVMCWWRCEFVVVPAHVTDLQHYRCQECAVFASISECYAPHTRRNAHD